MSQTDRHQDEENPLSLEETITQAKEVLDGMGSELIALRRTLHRNPSLSGAEGPTAERVANWLREHTSGRLVEGLGGTGLAVVFGGASAPALLLRAELDALPIHEPTDATPHSSQLAGTSHKCGHDGHMTILCGVARLFEELPPAGRVVLLFQPAEEIGEGAQAVLDDPRFASLAPRRAFALHNLPGFPEGTVVLRNGTFAAASQGLHVCTKGETAHASTPHLGRSPALGLARMIQELSPLAADVLPGCRDAFITITQLVMGQACYGVAPGAGELRATLRATRDEDLAALLKAAVLRIKRIAASEGIEAEISHHEQFSAVVNDDHGSELVERAAGLAKLPMHHVEEPFPWSEDFGKLLAGRSGALFGLGAGTNAPPMHSVNYDFPDALLNPGALCFYALAQLALADDDEGSAEASRAQPAGEASPAESEP